jgi:protein TonB
MPRDLFAAPSMTTVRSARRRLTLVCSTVAHAGVLALIVVLPLVSGLSLPELSRELYFVSVIAAPPLPPPPTPRAPVNVAAVAPASISGAAPTDAPPTIAPEGDHTARVLPDGLRLNGAPENPFGVDGGTGRDTPVLSAPPAPRIPIPVGGNIRPPERTFNVDPVYPAIAQAAHVEGRVIIEATIDERGHVINTRVLRSVPLLDRAALDAVGRWRYTPTTLNGVAVAVIMTVTVTFSMR